MLEAQHGTVLDEYYLPLGSKDMQAVIDKIEQQQPDVILNNPEFNLQVQFDNSLFIMNKNNPLNNLALLILHHT